MRLRLVGTYHLSKTMMKLRVRRPKFVSVILSSSAAKDPNQESSSIISENQFASEGSLPAPIIELCSMTRNCPNSIGKPYECAMVFFIGRNQMITTRFDDVFLLPARSQKVRASRRTNVSADDLEFSNFGRSPRINIAWVFLAATCFWAIVVGLVVLAT